METNIFANTLNNTVVAPPRMLIAFLENNLQADGSVRIPEVLRPYMGGMTEIKGNKNASISECHRIWQHEVKKELYEILDKVEQQYTCHELVYQDEELDFCEYQKEFGPGMGICLCGDMDSVDNLRKDIIIHIFLEQESRPMQISRLSAEWTERPM